MSSPSSASRGLRPATPAEAIEMAEEIVRAEATEKSEWYMVAQKEAYQLERMTDMLQQTIAPGEEKKFGKKASSL